MIYTSKRSFKDFFKTKNLKYYGAFFVLFLVVIAAIIIVSKNISDKKTDDNSDMIVSENETTSSDDNKEIVAGVYTLTLNMANHIVTVEDRNSDIVRYMLCSYDESLETGTINGNSRDGIRLVWNSNSIGCSRYFISFGDISIHSALYMETNNKASLDASDYNSIGNGYGKLSGITLQVEDAKWVYENCSFESVVVIKDDADEKIHTDGMIMVYVPEGIGWDPSEDNEASPWIKTEIGSINGPNEITIEAGSSKSVLSEISALDVNGDSVITHLYVTGEFDTTKVGEYDVELNIIDIYGNHIIKPYAIIVIEGGTDTTEESTSSDNNKETTRQESTTDTSGNETTTAQTTAASEETTTESQSESESENTETTALETTENNTTTG